LAAHHIRCDTGEFRDLCGERDDGIDQHLEAGDYLGSAHDRGCDLDDAVALGVPSRGLEVDDRDLLLKAEDRTAGTLRERRIGGADVRVGARNEEGVEDLRSHPASLARTSDSQTRAGRLS